MRKHLPNLLTCLNLFFGAIGCLEVLAGHLDKAIYFVVICGFFDFLDGMVARALNVHSAIGKELDSLADVVSFGLLPAFLMLRLIEQANPFHPYLAYFGLLVVVFSALRLARFNVDENQSDKFIGLPTPANAIMLSSLPYLPIVLFPGFWGILIISGVSSLLLVSPITMIALKFKGFSWSSNYLKYILIAACILIIMILGLDGIPFIIPAYILVSILGNFVHRDDINQPIK